MTEIPTRAFDAPPEAPMSDAPELKPCPFCGSIFVAVCKGRMGNGAPFHYVECADCAASCETPGQWNRRNDLPPTPEQIAVDPKVAALVDVCKKVDDYLLRLQTPGSEPLNSVNSSRLKSARGYFTAEVRNEARAHWSELGNALAAFQQGDEA